MLMTCVAIMAAAAGRTKKSKLLYGWLVEAGGTACGLLGCSQVGAAGGGDIAWLLQGAGLLEAGRVVRGEAALTVLVAGWGSGAFCVGWNLLQAFCSKVGCAGRPFGCSLVAPAALGCMYACLWLHVDSIVLRHLAPATARGRGARHMFVLSDE